MHIKLNNISYSHVQLQANSNKEKLFSNLNFTLSDKKTGLAGDNGSGKTTLLNIITGKIKPDEGNVLTEGSVVLFPQDLSSYGNMLISEVLGVKEKLSALEKILQGKSDEKDYVILNDEWDLNERITEIFIEAKLEGINLERKFNTLSGGEKSRLLFASLLLNKSDFALLDEPTNHLDSQSREILYSLIKKYKRGLLIVSHDRKLLNLMEQISELSPKGIRSYGGNYDFYKEQKEIEIRASEEVYSALQLQHTKAVKEKIKTIEKQKGRMERGKKNFAASGMAKIMKNYLEDKSMKTISRLKETHTQKTILLNEKLAVAKDNLENKTRIAIDMESPEMRANKIILEVKDLNFKFPAAEKFLWNDEINFSVSGGERWNIAGLNGSGKSVLLKIILNKLKPVNGEVILRSNKIAFLDQDVEILNNELTVFENLKAYSHSKIPEHELRVKLSRFLFRGEDAFKKVKFLSGGEKMRAGLACILASGNIPELLILDEPSNNLDLKSLAELTDALNSYSGAILIVSHDKQFLNEINITKRLYISGTENHKITLY